MPLEAPMRGCERWRFAAGAAVVLALVIAGIVCGLRQQRPARRAQVSETRAALNTFVAVTVVAENASRAGEHIAAAFARLAQLEGTLSAHRPDSELSRLNSGAAGGCVSVSDDLYRAVEAGVNWHRRTLGAFNITVAPLLELWKNCGRQQRLPTQDELDKARASLGVDRIQMDSGKRHVRWFTEGMRIDLGGLGKGYCADELVKLLRARGVRDALISIAGDIYALGRREDGAPWRVGIQDPRRPDSPESLIGTLELSDMAVSTSGNYQRFVEIRGKRYSHIVDPRTGMTADAVPSVTVIGPDALTTDVLGTALSVLGVEEGLRLVAKMPGVEAMFVTFDERNEPRIFRSPGFARFEAVGGSHRR